MPVKKKRFLKLKYQRERLDLEQENIATLLGCTKGNYANKESGKTRFYLHECIIILDAFNKLLRKKHLPELKLEDIFLD